MSESPDNLAGSGERDSNGRFLPGHKGLGGRPRGFDFRRVVTEYSERHGVTVEDAIWAIYTAMLKQARKGDVAAAKLLLDRLCDATGTESAEDFAKSVTIALAQARALG